MEVGISERFGLPGHDLAHVTRIARAIEQRGFDSYWTPEHVAVRAAGTGGYRDGSGETVLADAPSFPDPFINLTAVAAATERLLLGTAVLLAPLHHPIAIARAGATLDALSGGRFVLGVGVGWEPWEYATLGVPWKGRGERADEHLEAVLALWREQPASYRGAHVSFDSVLLEPRPARQPHPPVIVGGNSDAALRRAAHLADGWFGWGLELDELDRARRSLHCLLSGSGRDGEDFQIQLGTRFDGNVERLARYAAGARARGVGRLVVTCGPEGTVDERQLDEIARACGPLGASDSAHAPLPASPARAALASRAI